MIWEVQRVSTLEILARHLPFSLKEEFLRLHNPGYSPVDISVKV